MLNVGITGGIGSGKTTCCKIFESLGIPIYYADDRAKWLMWKSIPLKEEIKVLLGENAYYRNGRLNRGYVASQIFSNDKLLHKINALVHPAVAKDTHAWATQQKDAPYILKEAALLVENGSYKALDKLIVVTAPEELRIRRVMLRDKSNRDAIKQRMDKQLPEEQKTAVADYIIVNDGKQSLIQQIVKIHTLLINC